MTQHSADHTCQNNKLDFQSLGDFKPSRRWQAKWIWNDDDPCRKNAFCLFRSKFNLAKLPGKVLIHITADTRYQLFVNGQFVGRGTPMSQPYYQYYDTRDIRAYLQAGDNSIGIIVNHLGTMPDTRGGLLAQVVDQDDNMLCGTDQTWRVCKATAWASNMYKFGMNQATPFQECFDLRKMPSGWDTVEFDDSTWDQAQIISGRISDIPPAVTPWVRLVPRDIPFMSETPRLPEAIACVEECLDLANRMRGEDLSIVLSMPGKPVKFSICDNAQSLLEDAGHAALCCSTQHQDHVFDGRHDPCVLLDFGRVINAFAQVEIEGVDGAMLDIGYAERLIDGQFNIALEGQFADRLIMKDGLQVYQPFTWKAFRYMKIRLRSCEKPVRLLSIKAIETTYPFEPAGMFDSDDQTLNAVYDISQYTLRLCSNEFIMDTPWREQAQWLGDVAAVSIGGLHTCFGDTQLTGKFFRQSAANPMPTGMLSNVSNSIDFSWQNTIPDYSLWWIMGLWQHYQYTGQVNWIHDSWPAILRIVQGHLPYLNEYGLIENMPTWVFVDWAPLDRRGECAAYNAIFYGALQAVTQMAQIKQDQHTLDWVQQLRALMRANFYARLFDGDKGCYADARVNDELSETISEHANLSAVYWGLCDDDVAHSLVKLFYEQRSIEYVEAQPFYMCVILQALSNLGRMDLAIELIRDRWGKRMVQKGARSTYEEWGINGSWRNGWYHGFIRSQSHAWSACPAQFLIRHVIGLKILEPGCKRVSLDPWQAPFDYKVTYPTVAGSIEVSWQKGKARITTPDTVQLV